MRYEEFTIEGRNAVIEAYRAGRPIDKLFILDGCQDGPILTIKREAKAKQTPVKFVTKERLDQLSETGKHQGVIAYAAAYEYATVEEILDNAERIRSLKHLRIVGVHLHIGSQIRELHVFENMCQKVNVIVENLERLGFSFRFVDVGGGLGINYDMPENEPIPNFASLFAIVHNHLRVGDREVHFEFGRSIVGECGELITRVLFNKTTATGRKLLIVDASMTELIRPALYGSYHNIENITAETDRTDKYTVVGTACESTDRFDENVSLRRSVRGDLLTIKSAGAYGMSMASRYNLHDLPGAVYGEDLM